MHSLFFCLALLTGCMSNAPPGDVPRFLALGDSYTIGEGVEPAARWPVQLAARLRASGAEIGDPELIAVTGWRTDELDAGIDEAAPEGPYALVTLLIGVNNQYQGVSTGQYRSHFRGLLRRAVALAGGDPGRVVVVSIPDWGVTPFAEDRDRALIAEQIDAYNTAAERIAKASGARWADVTPLSREQGAMVVGDGLHPSGDAYAAWTERILPFAHGALVPPPAQP